MLTVFNLICQAEDTVEVRRRLGVCPQHNVLWEELTCEVMASFIIDTLTDLDRSTYSSALP